MGTINEVENASLYCFSQLCGSLMVFLAEKQNFGL